MKNNQSPTRAVIVIPTYNERANIAGLLKALTHVAPSVDILVVDDRSPDGTGQIVADFAARNPRVTLLSRDGRGLAGAYLAGFAYALEKKYDRIIQMDADFSHDPIVVPRLIKMLDEGDCDVAVGCRYLPGGRIVGWTFFRTLLSHLGNLYARLLLGVPYFDLTGGFNAWRASALARVLRNLPKVNGYSFLIILKYLAYQNGFRIREVPITFQDRTGGESKMSSSIIFEALGKVPAMGFRLAAGKKIRCVVGAGIVGVLLAIPVVEKLCPTPQDVHTFYRWMLLALESGVRHVYEWPSDLVGARFGDYRPNYPPLLFVIFYPGFFLLNKLGHLPGWPSPVTNLIFRALPWLAQIAAPILVLQYAIRHRLANVTPLTILLFILSPALLIAGPLWGQYDAVQWLLCFAALARLVDGEPYSAGILAALAALLKPQFLMFAPFFALALMVQPKFAAVRRWTLGFVGTVFLLTLPFTISHGFSWFVHGYERASQGEEYYTITAYNFWWIMGRAFGISSLDQPLLGFAGKSVAFALTAIALGPICVKILVSRWRNFASYWIPLASVYFVTAYAFLPGMSARFLGFGLLWTLAWAFANRRVVAPAIALTLLEVSALFYNPTWEPHSRFWGWVSERGALAIGFGSSILLLATLIWLNKIFFGALRTEAATRLSQARAVPGALSSETVLNEP